MSDIDSMFGASLSTTWMVCEATVSLPHKSVAVKVRTMVY